MNVLYKTVGLSTLFSRNRYCNNRQLITSEFQTILHSKLLEKCLTKNISYKYHLFKSFHLMEYIPLEILSYKGVFPKWTISHQRFSIHSLDGVLSCKSLCGVLIYWSRSPFVSRVTLSVLQKSIICELYLFIYGMNFNFFSLIVSTIFSRTKTKYVLGKTKLCQNSMTKLFFGGEGALTKIWWPWTCSTLSCLQMWKIWNTTLSRINSSQCSCGTWSEPDDRP